MTKLNGLPKRVHLLIVASLLAGGACVAARLPEVARWNGLDLLAFAGLVAAIAIADQFPVALRHGMETQNWLLTDSLWAAALMLVRPGVLTLAVAAGVLIGESIRRWALYKVAFNVGQFVVGITVAQLIYRAIDPPGLPSPMALVAATVAMLGYFVVNVSAVALVIAVAERKPFLAVLARPFGLTAFQWAGNLAMGILGALIWDRNPAGLPALAVMVGVCYFAYRGRLKDLHEREAREVAAKLALVSA